MKGSGQVKIDNRVYRKINFSCILYYGIINFILVKSVEEFIALSFRWTHIQIIEF